MLFFNLLFIQVTDHCNIITVSGADPHWFPPFTEISQILHSGYILNKDKKLSKLQGFILGAWNWPISCLNDLETQERGF